MIDHSPLNMFTVNTEHDAHAVLTYIEKHKLLNTRGEQMCDKCNVVLHLRLGF